MKRVGELTPEEHEARKKADRERWHRRKHGRKLPEGQRLRGVSTLRGPNGELLREWEKTERASDDPPKFEPVPPGHVVRQTATFVDGQGQVRGQWITARPEEQTRWASFWAAAERAAEAYAGRARPSAVQHRTDATSLTVYGLGDPHIGMFSWAKETGQDFDLKIAQEDLLNTVDLLVERAPASSRALLANVGDFYHADDASQLTPGHGHKLDVDSRWPKVLDTGFTLMVHMIDVLLRKHERVEVANAPGNHDPHTARMLAMFLRAWYRNEPRVRILPNFDPFIYVRHGQNLIGVTHGVGLKMEDLPLIMATDRAADWGETTFHHWFTGHIHHMVRKEFPSCVVEALRTLATRDYWHHSRGYRSGQSLSCVTFDERYGETTRITVDLKLARALTIK